MSAFVPLWYRNYQLSRLIGDEKGGAFVPSLLLKTQHLHLQDRLVVTHNSLLQQETKAFLELLKHVPFCKPDIHIVQQSFADQPTTCDISASSWRWMAWTNVTWLSWNLYGGLCQPEEIRAKRWGSNSKLMTYLKFIVQFIKLHD